jgi:hypothetical protein
MTTLSITCPPCRCPLVAEYMVAYTHQLWSDPEQEWEEGIVTLIDYIKTTEMVDDRNTMNEGDTQTLPESQIYKNHPTPDFSLTESYCAYLKQYGWASEDVREVCFGDTPPSLRVFIEAVMYEWCSKVTVSLEDKNNRTAG